MTSLGRDRALYNGKLKFVQYRDESANNFSMTGTREPCWTDRSSLMRNRLYFLACRNYCNSKTFKVIRRCFCLLKFIGNKALHLRTIFTHRKGLVVNGMWLHQASSSHPTFQFLLSHRVWAVWRGCQLLIRISHICREIINTWLHTYTSHTPSPLQN